MSSDDGTLSGLRILVVEDNYLLAEHVRSMLLDHGCQVLGPASRVAAALVLVRSSGDIDGAVLDINLAGEKCFPVAAALLQRGVPFVFVSGYDDRGLIPTEFADVPALAKPADEGRLVATLASTIAGGARHESG
jgi:CheY-like chemotaxis protein